MRRENAAAELRRQWLPLVADVRLDELAGVLECELSVPAGLTVLRGHFPSVPIVPGVLLVGWAVELGQRYELVTGRFKGIAAAKFRRIVRPGMRLAARLERAGGTSQLQFNYRHRDTVVTTGRLIFEGDRG